MITTEGLGLGMRLDTPHKRRTYKMAVGPQGLFTSSPSLTTGLESVEAYEALVLDQGPTGSCEGHSGAQATWMDLLAAGNPLPWFPSPDGFYRDIRCLERAPGLDGKLPPLQDGGGMTADSIAALRYCGLRKMGPSAGGRNSDCDPSTVNDEPTLDQLDQEALTSIRVDPGGFAVDLTNRTQAIATIQAALKAKHPVRIDIFCDSAFQDFFLNYTPGKKLTTCDLNDPNGGGHAIVLGALDVASDQSFVAAGPNSWGALGAGPLVKDGCVNDSGHWVGTQDWFFTAVQQVTIWACTQIGAVS